MLLHVLNNRDKHRFLETTYALLIGSGG